MFQWHLSSAESPQVKTHIVGYPMAVNIQRRALGDIMMEMLHASPLEPKYVEFHTISELLVYRSDRIIR